MLKKILSVRPQSFPINLSLFILRLSAGILMIPHGYSKLIHFTEKQNSFETFLGINSSVSLALTIGAEFFCSLLLSLGFMTRIVLVPLIITMLVAEFKTMNGAVFGDGQLAFMYLVIYAVLFISGPGKLSIDNYLFKNNLG